MSYDAQRIAIQTRFKTAWQAAYPSIPFIFSNVQLSKPAGAYVRLDILNGDSALKGMGQSRLYRYAGIISIDIYVPEKEGIGNADRYADTIAPIFQGQNFSGTVCRAVNRNDLGLADGYYRVNLSISFYRDKLTP